MEDSKAFEERHAAMMRKADKLAELGRQFAAAGPGRRKRIGREIKRLSGELAGYYRECVATITCHDAVPLPDIKDFRGN